MRTPTDVCEIGRLKRRADFLRVGTGKRWHAKVVTIQTAAHQEADTGVRIGFTLTRKVGNAVVRNRTRRRLKEAIRLSGPRLPLDAGHDYVVIGRKDALNLPFDQLQTEIISTFEALRLRAGRARSERATKRQGDTATKKQDKTARTPA